MYVSGFAEVGGCRVCSSGCAEVGAGGSTDLSCPAEAVGGCTELLWPGAEEGFCGGPWEGGGDVPGLGRSNATVLPGWSRAKGALF